MTKPQKLLLLAAVASIALWAIPVARYLILPLNYLNTHFHELAHAIMALATGGMPSYIHVYADGSGVTPVSGGNILLVASAGYPGTAILGSLLILAGRKPESAAKALKALSIILGISLILLIRGDLIGILSAFILIPTLWLLAIKLKKENLQFASQFVGLQMCLTSAQSFLNLFQISISNSTPTDASILQDIYIIPSIAWVTGWIIFSLICTYTSLRIAWKNK